MSLKKAPAHPCDRPEPRVEAEIDQIVHHLRESIFHHLSRKGAVVGLSGGVDSSVVLALCVRALGAERVLGVLLPEQESSPESEDLAHLMAEGYGVPTMTEDITPVLEALQCYQRRDAAIQRVFPEFGPGWKAKIILPRSLLEDNTLNVYSLAVISPDGEEFSQRLPLREYSEIVAASNFKQRVRMTMLYYQAESRHYAVVGTANKDEHDLGFFVKHGDSAVDVAPIVHLFKTEVYQLARCLKVPEEICERVPTTDTYSAECTQEEFFFRVPFEILDAVWAEHEKGTRADEIAHALGLSVAQVDRVIKDIARKQRSASYLQACEPCRIMREVA